jgi:sigma-B regulation protein RsbU (phosphoserine phosphatase)
VGLGAQRLQPRALPRTANGSPNHHGNDKGDDMPLEISELKESNDFLNTLLDHITSAVFIADKNMRIHSVNNALQTLFYAKEDRILGQLLGNAVGCGFAVLEGAVCGTTSHCDQCLLRHSLFRSFTEKVPTYNEKIKREFYIDNKPILKYLQFSTRYIKYHGEEMVMIIVDDITETETQRMRLYEDLQAAAEIQRSLLPSTTEAIESLDVAWQFLPCQQIGGDIFNLVQLDRDHWGIYMLDVSGHGVPSAMMVVSITQLLQPYAGYLIKDSARSPSRHEIVRPGQVLMALDREYPLERFNNYFTITYLVLNTKTGVLHYSSAGHPKPVLVRAEGGLEELEEGGTVIGMDGIVPFGEGRVRLHPGDRLFVYTDGITEYENGSEEFFGKDRLYRELLRLKDRPLELAVQEVIGSLKHFGNHREPQDDISLLGLRLR